MIEIKYRKFIEKDNEAIIELWKKCNLIVPWNDPHKDIMRKLKIKDDLFIIGEKSKKIIASAMAGYDGHRGYIYYLAVLPEYQKKGVGSEILEIVENKLLKIGCPKINLFVRNSNVKVKNFYKINYYKLQDSQVYGKRLIEDN
ncbi:MAG: GNAT family acetyltransferase [Pelagibacteraceae bacterium]|nr:GNAT family acetyltransferase [Pelagibacteraceae bacterium]|tara:strand:+ start:10714 stop:11142 length:429 start_codon:yes stop_codon:yes gene_type:complete